MPRLRTAREMGPEAELWLGATLRYMGRRLGVAVELPAIGDVEYADVITTATTTIAEALDARDLVDHCNRGEPAETFVPKIERTISRLARRLASAATDEQLGSG